MNLKVTKSENLKGSFQLPTSKAHGWRALFIAGLAEGESRIRNAKESKDWYKGIDGMTMFGADYQKNEDLNEWIVNGIGDKPLVPEDILQGGNSGPLLRYFIAIAAAINEQYTVITGDHSLRSIRPAGPIVDAVNQLGGWAVTSKGDNHAPVIVKGRITGGSCRVDGADSQTISGLLLGCCLCTEDTEILVDNPGEKGWVDLTLYWLREAGMEIENVGDNYNHYKIKGGKKFNPIDRTIPLDWQAAPTPIITGILIPGSEITIEGIDTEDVLPDRQVVYALQRMGANIEMGDNKVVAKYSPNLKGIKVDPNTFTDQFLPIAIAAAFAEGETEIYNNEIQRHKECDRISAVTQGLRAMGVEVEEKQDGMIIKGNGGQDLKGALIDGYKDHRMLMNFVVAGMRATGETIISDAEYLEKTFKSFDDQLRSLGANAEFID